MMIQVIEQMALAVLAEGNPPFFGAFAPDGENPVFAVEAIASQAAELRHADARVIEHPEDRAIAHRGPFGDRTRFVGRSARPQQALKFLRGNGLDERLADLGEGHQVKGVALDQLAADQPVKERARSGHRFEPCALPAFCPVRPGWSAAKLTSRSTSIFVRWAAARASVTTDPRGLRWREGVAAFGAGDGEK